MTVADLLGILFPPGSSVRLTPDQERIVRHPVGQLGYWPARDPARPKCSRCWRCA